MRSRNFNELFAANDDPWGYRTHWYEVRKRALALACLPRARYDHGYEPGCANGELAAELATRCNTFIASDSAARACELAQQRLAPLKHVRVLQQQLPRQWSDASFDLIVLSEFCFYLDSDELAAVIGKVRHTLRSDGNLVACHWRHAINGFPLSGAQVHQQLDDGLQMSKLIRHEEPDFILEIWSPDRTSVAQRDGLI